MESVRRKTVVCSSLRYCIVPASIKELELFQLLIKCCGCGCESLDLALYLSDIQ